MRDELQKRCQLFIQNRDIVKNAFGWESYYIYPLCASLFTIRGIQADAGVMKDCRDLLKEKTGFFSNFRGISKMATVTTLSLSPSPENKLNQLLDIYGKLKEVFWGSEYLTVAASVISDMAEPGQYEQITHRTRTIYNRMKETHPFLTSGEDSSFAALLALSELDDIYIEQEMERCYTLLKPYFFSGNAVQSLSHILALGEGSAAQKCEKAMALFDYLKSHGHKYGTSYELATLGVLALLDTDIKTLAQDIMDVDDYLHSQKGFGAFGIGARQRLMYAGVLTMCDYMPQLQPMKTAALNGVVSLVIAQQAALCASAAAASAAATSASSSSS